MAKSKSKTSSVKNQKSTKAAKPAAKAPKAKPVVNKAKAVAKPDKKAGVTEKPLKSLVKAVATVIAKATKADKAAKPAKNTKVEKTGKVEPKVDAKSVEVSKPKKEKASKKSKKKTEEFEIEEEDLLAGDEDVGSEEIPDLSEFDVEVEEPEEEAPEAPGAAADWVAASKSESDEVVLTDAEGRKYCRVRDCDQAAVVESYCRYHYLLLWKRIQVRRKILADGKLERYVEELTSRYPDKFLEMIRKDLRSEKDFLAAIAELEIDESASENEFEDETQTFIDEVRGMSSETSMSDDDEF